MFSHFTLFPLFPSTQRSNAIREWTAHRHIISEIETESYRSKAAHLQMIDQILSILHGTHFTKEEFNTAIFDAAHVDSAYFKHPDYPTVKALLTLTDQNQLIKETAYVIAVMCVAGVIYDVANENKMMNTASLITSSIKRGLMNVWQRLPDEKDLDEENSKNFTPSYFR